MPIQSDEWIGPFNLEELPEWKCPRCNRGHLRRIKNKNIKVHTRESFQNLGHDVWEPSWSEERYSFLLKCSMSSCGETFLGIGKMTLEEAYDPDDHSQLIIEKVKPYFFYPQINMFKIPINCPKDIVHNLTGAFALYWCAPNAAGNKIRTCVDLILDYKRVNKTDGKRTRGYMLSLHKRIKLLKNKDKWLREKLFAIKWLGNVGSHGRGLTHRKFLSGLIILEYVIEEVFEKRSAKISSLSRRINRNRGRF